MQVHLHFFANQTFSRHKKTKLLHKWIALVLRVKFCFMSCLSKGKCPSIRKQSASLLSSQLVVLVFTEQPSAERYLGNFCQSFCELLENSSSASRYVQKRFGLFTKNHLCRSLMLVKLQAFTGAATRCVLWKGVFRKVFAKSTGKGQCQRLYFNKVAFLGL